MTLTAYLIQRFLLALAGVLGGMFVLQFLIGIELHLSSYGDLKFSPLEIIGLTLLKAPESIYVFLPSIVAFAALWTSLRLASTSEMPVIRTFGKSGFSTLAVPALVAAVIGIVAVTAVNPVISAMSKKHRDLVFRDSGDGTQIFIQEDGLIWLRQVIDNQQTVIRSSNTTGGRLFEDVHVFMFDSVGQPTKRIHSLTGELVEDTRNREDVSRSASARFGQDPVPGLCLKDLRVWNHLAEKGMVGAPPIRVAAECLATRLTPEQIRESLDQPNTVSFWKLLSMIDRLEEAGFSSAKHRFHLQSELAKPLLLASMVLLGGTLALRQNRFVNLPLNVTLTFVVILAAVILGNLAQFLGEREDIPVALAAWLPPLIVSLVSLGGLLYLEDG